jgi:cytochrome c6
LIVILSRLPLASEGSGRAARCGAFSAPHQNRALGSLPYQTDPLPNLLRLPKHANLCGVVPPSVFVPFLGELLMKSVLKLFLGALAFGWLFSTFLLAESGADNFKGKCAMCHGADGKGETAIGKRLNVPDLGSSAVQNQSDAELTNIITNGKNKMPKFDDRLTRDEIGEVVKYIRTLKH